MVGVKCPNGLCDHIAMKTKKEKGFSKNTLLHVFLFLPENHLQILSGALEGMQHYRHMVGVPLFTL